jgi:hypothetical protein
LAQPGLDLRLAHLDAVGRHRGAVEVLGELAQRRVAALAHGVDDGPHLVEIAAELGLRPQEQP